MVKDFSEHADGPPRRRLRIKAASKEDIISMHEATHGEFDQMHSLATDLVERDKSEEAIKVAQEALLRAHGKGGVLEATVIISYLPMLLSFAPVGTVKQAARRASLLLIGRKACAYLLSAAYYYEMQAEIRLGDRRTAHRLASKSIAAAKESNIICGWIASVWRYHGILSAMLGQREEGLISLATSVDLARVSGSDDVLVIARSHDAAGRIMAELKQYGLARASFSQAIDEYLKHGKICESELKLTRDALASLPND